MRVLVTGGAGYVGSVVARRLADAGHRVHVVDDLSSGHRAAVGADIAFTQGDSGDFALVRDLLTRERIDAVVHTAGAARVEDTPPDSRRYVRQNVVNAIALADAMLDCGVTRLVFSSSAAVYGEPRELPITEAHPQAPINLYGTTKLIFERVLAAYHRGHGLDSIALRYFNAAGAVGELGEDHAPETHVVPLLLRAAAEGTTFSIFGTDYDTPDGSCVRDYVHVADLADAHVLALAHVDRVGHAAFNLGTGSGTSVKALVAAARKVTGARIAVESCPRRAGDPAVLVASAARAEAELGWLARASDPETILRSAWDWQRAHPQGYAERAAAKS